VLFASNLSKPFIAIRNFELALIESFVIPLANAYGQNDEYSFITRNALQFLMEIKSNISDYINCIDFDVVTIPIKSSIAAYKQYQKNKQSEIKSLSLSPPSKIEKDRVKTPQIENDEDLNGECAFYENQLSVIDAFCVQIENEIDFTKHAQQQLQNDDYLKQIFDFNLNDIDMSIDEQNKNEENVMNDDDFINQIASEIDKIYTEYALDFRRIQYEQNRFEYQLKQREIEQFELAQYYKSNEDEVDMDNIHKKIRLDSMKMNERTKDRLILSNCIKANRENDYNEDVMNNINYLRRLDGYQMNEDDTMNMDIDTI